MKKTNKYKVTQEKLQKLLKTRFLGRTMEIFDTVESTNTIAEERANAGADEGLAIVARRQSTGVGRFGRRWISPFGGLWFSIILRPNVKDPSPLPVIFGGCIAKALKEQTGMEFGFHWPNDVYHEVGKTGGVLVMSKFTGARPEHVIAGVGINCNFPASVLYGDLLNPAATLLDVLGKESDLNVVMAGILNRLEADCGAWQKDGPEGVIGQYKDRCMTIGRDVEIVSENGEPETARVLDLTGEGRLVILKHDGSEEVLSNAYRVRLL